MIHLSHIIISEASNDISYSRDIGI